ncbi:MAG: SprT family zinc-dependent metalloprotease [Candidatus Latescibacterota bacterium]|jgi:hypothetical protein
MRQTDGLHTSTDHRIRLGGRLVYYRVIHSKAARKLRVRVGPRGVEVVQPRSRKGGEVPKFLTAHGTWVIDQLDRAERMHGVRRTEPVPLGAILFRGEMTKVRIEMARSRATGNAVRLVGGQIVVSSGSNSVTPVARSLELWLRREARREIEGYLGVVTMRIRRHARRLYVMGQRTKWGNCSPSGNLSFNWRLILAPRYVLQYLVTHEAVHLAVPDHSVKFWLTVQSLCRDTEKARQWLCRHQTQMQVDLASILNRVPRRDRKAKHDHLAWPPVCTLEAGSF